MKGGEASMIHIGMKNGFIVFVYKLGKTINDPIIPLEEEFDYKIEYLDRKGTKVKYKKGKDGWIIPLVYKSKKGA